MKKDTSTSFMLPEINKYYKDLMNIIGEFEFLPWVQAIIYFIIGLMITLVFCWFVGKVTEKNISAHHSMLFKRIAFYVGFTLSLIFPLRASGVDVTALLGAAGILTAAVAFAAQTSISNFLSGVFLVAEKPFMIGDTVRMDAILGEVLSIDLLSVKIRTKDNTMVRIPNEMLLKSQFRNESRFPIRRFDMKLKVNFNEDLEKIKTILLQASHDNPLSLVNPAPQITFQEFADTGVLLQFSTWASQQSFDALQSSLQSDIQKAFRKENITLPKSMVVGE